MDTDECRSVLPIFVGIGIDEYATRLGVSDHSHRKEKQVSTSSIAAGLAVIMSVMPAGIPALSHSLFPEQLTASQTVSMVENAPEQRFMPRICQFFPNIPDCEKHRPQK